MGFWDDENAEDEWGAESWFEDENVEPKSESETEENWGNFWDDESVKDENLVAEPQPEPATEPKKQITKTKKHQGRKPGSGLFTVEQLNEARFLASQKRAQVLLGIAQEKYDIWGALNAATKPHNHHLLKIKLVALLESQPEWGHTRSMNCVKHVASVCATKTEPHNLTIGWLLSTQGGGNRFDALVDFYAANRGLPWHGFPFAQKPKGAL